MSSYKNCLCGKVIKSTFKNCFECNNKTKFKISRIPTLKELFKEQKQLNLLDNGYLPAFLEYKCCQCDTVLMTGKIQRGNYDYCFKCFTKRDKIQPKEKEKQTYDFSSEFDDDE